MKITVGFKSIDDLRLRKNEIMLEQKILICKYNVHVFVIT